MKIIIFGNKETASLANFYIKNDTEHTVEAFCLDSNFIKESNFENIPIIPFDEIECTFPPEKYIMFLPICENKLRREKYLTSKQKGYNLYTYISSKATCWTKNIGENCFILENNVIQPYVEIGNNTIIWSGNHIGHHSKIGSNVFISSHVVISGHVTVEDSAWIGVNASIKDNLFIKKNTIIGMGTVVIKNTIEGKTFVGNPAKVLE